MPFELPRMPFEQFKQPITGHAVPAFEFKEILLVVEIWSLPEEVVLQSLRD